MARIDLQRLAERLTKAFHQELIDLKLGPLGPAADEEPEQTYQVFTLPVPLESNGAPMALVKRAASELAHVVRTNRPSYLARMPLPAEESGLDAVRIDREDWRVSLRLVFLGGDPIYPYGRLMLDVVGVPPAAVHSAAVY